MYKPSVIIFDYETSGLSYWEADFQVLSCAFSWRNEDGELKTRVTMGEIETRQMLAKIKDQGIPLVCHNIGFEYGVTKSRFPGYEDLITIDTMRLAQVYDNGGPGDDTKGRFGLSACIERILPSKAGSKEPYYKWIRDNLGAKPGKEGKHIRELPEDLLRDYNAADTMVTHLLYEKITGEFEKIGYDWRLDHTLYINIARHISDAKARGILVDFDKLIAARSSIEAEISEIDRQTQEYFSRYIAEIEAEKRDKWVNGVTSIKGRQNRLDSLDKHEKAWKFNPRSPLDKKTLLVDKQGVSPTFFTPKGGPSFAAAHIHTYGEGGKLMATRNKRAFVLNQVNNLLQLSAKDFRWHTEVRATGTKTGRLASGEKDDFSS